MEYHLGNNYISCRLNVEYAVPYQSKMFLHLDLELDQVLVVEMVILKDVELDIDSDTL